MSWTPKRCAKTSCYFTRIRETKRPPRSGLGGLTVPGSGDMRGLGVLSGQSNLDHATWFQTGLKFPHQLPQQASPAGDTGSHSSRTYGFGCGWVSAALGLLPGAFTGAAPAPGLALASGLFWMVFCPVSPALPPVAEVWSAGLAARCGSRLFTTNVPIK